MKQIVDLVPLVLLLHDVVKQMMEQLVDIFFFYLSISVLLSRLSKCLQSCVHPALLAQASVRRRRNSCLKCGRPYPTHRYCSGLWSTTSTFQFLIMQGELLIFKVFLPGQSSTALQERFSERLLEQMIDCIPGGGPQGFRPGQSSSSSSHRPAGISEDR